MRSSCHTTEWPEHCSEADEVHDPKKKYIPHWSVQLQSRKPATEDRFSVCSRPCCSNIKAGGVNEALDEQKLQESNEPKKTLPSLEWELTGITIPVKKPKAPKGWSCAICQVKAPNTEHNIQEHCAGKKHQSNVATLESKNKTSSRKEETIAEPSSCAEQETSSVKWSYCTCQANGTEKAELKEHLIGRTHQQNIEAQCQEGGGMVKNTELEEAKTGITIPVKKPKAPKGWSCAICQVEAPNTEHNIQEHCAGKKHQSNVATLESKNKTSSQKEETIAEPSSCAEQETSSIKWSCSTCQANGTDKAKLKEHLNGRTHQQNIEAHFQEGGRMVKNTELEEAKTGITIPVKIPKAPKGWSCAICQVEALNTEHSIQEHCAGKKHRSNVATLESKNKTISQKEETIAEPSSCAEQETFSIKWSCSTWQAKGTDETELKEHLNGRIHQQNIEAQCQEGGGMVKNTELEEAKTGITIPVKKTKAPQSWSCAICQVEAPNMEHSIQEHCAGKKHRSNVAALESKNKTISPKEQTIAEPSCAEQETSSIKWSCSKCQASGTDEAELKEHLNGRTHQQNIEAQCQEGGGMVKNTELEEAKCHKSTVPQHSEKSPCSTCQDSCISESELGSLLLAKLQDLLDAINNMATISESHQDKFVPNNVLQDAEQISQSNGSICQTGSDYRSCSSEPQSENHHRIRRRRKKRGALQVEGQDAEPGNMKLGDEISSDGSCSKSRSSVEKLAPYLCVFCNLDLNSKSRLADHCNEEEHLEKQKLLTFCKVCNLQCNSSKMLAHHCTGKKHLKNVNANK